MKELAFLKNTSIALNSDPSSQCFQAAFSISQINYKIFDKSFGLFSSMETQEFIFPELIFTSQKELKILGIYTQISMNSNNTHCWGVKTDSPLLKLIKKLCDNLNYITENEKVFLREWKESQPKKTNLTNLNTSLNNFHPEHFRNEKQINLKEAVNLYNQLSVYELGFLTTKLSKKASHHHFEYQFSDLIYADKNNWHSKPTFKTKLFAKNILLKISLSEVTTFNHFLSLLKKYLCKNIDKNILLSSKTINEIADKNNLSISSCLNTLKDIGIYGVYEEDWQSSSSQWFSFWSQVYQKGMFAFAQLEATDSEEDFKTLCRIFRLNALASHFSFLKIIPGKDCSCEQYLKLISISKLCLNSSLTIESDFKIVGLNLAQTALEYGADSIGASVANTLNKDTINNQAKKKQA